MQYKVAREGLHNHAVQGNLRTKQVSKFMGLTVSQRSCNSVDMGTNGGLKLET